MMQWNPLRWHNFWRLYRWITGRAWRIRPKQYRDLTEVEQAVAKDLGMNERHYLSLKGE